MTEESHTKTNFRSGTKNQCQGQHLPVYSNSEIYRNLNAISDEFRPGGNAFMIPAKRQNERKEITNPSLIQSRSKSENMPLSQHKARMKSTSEVVNKSLSKIKINIVEGCEKVSEKHQDVLLKSSFSGELSGKFFHNPDVEKQSLKDETLPKQSSYVCENRIQSNMINRERSQNQIANKNGSSPWYQLPDSKVSSRLAATFSSNNLNDVGNKNHIFLEKESKQKEQNITIKKQISWDNNLCFDKVNIEEKKTSNRYENCNTSQKFKFIDSRIQNQSSSDDSDINELSKNSETDFFSKNECSKKRGIQILNSECLYGENNTFYAGENIQTYENLKCNKNETPQYRRYSAPNRKDFVVPRDVKNKCSNSKRTGPPERVHSPPHSNDANASSGFEHTFETVPNGVKQRRQYSHNRYDQRRGITSPDKYRNVPFVRNKNENSFSGRDIGPQNTRGRGRGRGGRRMNFNPPRSQQKQINTDLLCKNTLDLSIDVKKEDPNNVLKVQSESEKSHLRDRLLYYGGEISDLIVGCNTTMSTFLSFYAKWKDIRRETMLLFESFEKGLSNTANKNNKIKDYINIIGAGANIATAVPIPKVSIAARILSVMFSGVGKIFNKSPKVKETEGNEFELMMRLQEDIEATTDIYMFGMQCNLQFEETCNLIDEFHGFLQDKKLEEITDNFERQYLNDIVKSNPRNLDAFYLRFRKTCEKLLTCQRSDIGKALCRGFVISPDALRVVDRLHWRFRGQEDNRTSEVQKAWMDIAHLLQNDGSATVNDVQKKIQNCILILIKERSLIERYAVDFQNFSFK